MKILGSWTSPNSLTVWVVDEQPPTAWKVNFPGNQSRLKTLLLIMTFIRLTLHAESDTGQSLQSLAMFCMKNY